ncbi:MAG: FAD-dependent oxidoreductase, partial [Candidatus Obscuribacterales bacterium]|nr:FAD-dependent oxidoreductase [Candidatus Obscuribacterales bacterium]
RREFLKKIVLCAGACLTGEVLKEQEAWSKSKYKISDWTGDDFTVGHRLRDGKLPRLPKTAEKKVDVVIVGGGIAGLAAAHYLSDHDLLLLEQYDKTGGHARGASYQGIDYSIGSQYFTNMNGDLGELLNELGLEPVEIKKQKNSWYIDQQLVNESEANSEHTINQEMKKLHGELKKFNSIFTSDLLTDYKNNADLKKLDQISLDSYLKGYDPKFSALLNSYCKSSMCGGIKQISALSGLSLLDDLNLSTFVFPGGNQKVSRQLFSRLEKRAAQARETGAFVWSIDVHDNGASIVYSAGKRLTRVDCKHVIIAIPHMITSRITHGIDDKIKATLFSFRYGSYLVANLLLRKRIFKSNFDNWFAPPLDFADLTIAETPY